MTDHVTTADKAHENEMARSNSLFLRAIRTGRPERTQLRWLNSNSSATWAQGSLSLEYRRALASNAHKEAVIARAVSRDPCFWCGVRHDIGCNH